MIFARSKTATPMRYMAITIASLATVMLVGVKDLAAQRPSSTKAVEPGVVPDLPDFTGSWNRAYVGPSTDPSLKGKIGSFGFVEDEACLERKDALGQPLKRCSLPFNE